MFSFVFNDLQKSILDPAEISSSKVYWAEVKKQRGENVKDSGKMRHRSYILSFLFFSLIFFCYASSFFKTLIIHSCSFS